MANTQMKRATLSRLTACCVVGLSASLALAQPAPAPAPRPPQPDETAGWTKLGHFELRGRGGKDVLAVGVQEGTFRRLLVKLVGKNPMAKAVLDVAQLKITFGNDEVMTVDWLVRLSGVVQPFAIIDLPGDVRHIKTIELRHKGRGRINVAVFAREAAPPPPPPPSPSPSPPTGGPARPGWEYLGTARVADGKLGPDIIRVGRKDGRFNKLMIAVEGDDLVLADVLVRFGNGETVSPAQGREYTFQQNVKSAELLLPNELRFVAAVGFRYARIAGGGKAQIHLYGMSDKTAPKPTPTPTPTPVPPAKAWGKLGVATIARGGGVIVVGKDAGAVRSVMLQVENSDAVLQDVVIEFGNGEKFSPPTKLVFAEGSRSRTIDLPGDARFIRKVTFRAQNLPGGGRASIVLFGR